MQTLINIFDIVLPVSYAVMFALYLARFWTDSESLSVARGALVVTWIAHVVYFIVLGIDYGYVPLSGKAEFLSLAALALLSVYGFIELYLKQAKTGVFFTAISLLFASLGAVFMTHDEDPSALLLENPIYGVHVVFMVMGFVALASGALYAFMYLLLERQLKSRDLGVFFKRLPPLMELERMANVATVAGTALLAFGMGLGYLVAIATIGEFDLLDPKLVVSNVVLVGYVVGVIAVKIRGFSGVSIAYATMIWFGVLLTSVGLASHPFS